MINMNMTGQKMKCSTFSSTSGVQESFFAGVSSDGLPLKEAFEEVAASYLAALQDNGLDLSTQQFMRIYMSDLSNDQVWLLESELYKIASTSAFSILQQSPLGDAEVAILAYHIKTNDNTFKKEIIAHAKEYNNQSVFSKGKNYSLLWTSNYISNDGGLDSYKQSQEIFTNLSASLQNHDMNIRNNMIRTWIFVRDVDNHYKGMVDYRREYFETIGLTSKTRYIASTGINGSCADNKTLVTLDALSVQNLKEEQIVRMMALENLSDTIVYGVTFERGFRIRYGDRSHIYISGTASIDADGKTIYISDIRKQTERTLDNIEALLKPHGAVMGDMQYLIIYLRNRKHWSQIQDILVARIPDSVAIVPVEAPVCRPNWLIEIEGVGAIPDTTEYLPFA
jgi:enamine deaminase RidA (YjgF/YER057c/UK114 family)